MLTEYIEAAMRKAKYELLGGEEGFYANIPGFAGVWANANSLENCRDALRSTLEDWILLKLQLGDNDLPVINKMNLNMKRRRAKVAQCRACLLSSGAS